MDEEIDWKAAEKAAAKSQAEAEGRIQHILKGNAELKEGTASLQQEADRLLGESKEARERTRFLAGGYRDNINGGQATFFEGML